MTTDVKLADRPLWKKRAWGTAITARRAVWGRPTATLRPTPDFILIGAQRSGTTSLYQYLAAHPDVRWPPHLKSPHWYDAHFDRSEAWYRAHFPLSLPGRPRTWLTGEAAPYYLFHPAVPQRIASFAPRARLIAVLREPGDRAWSHYQHERARGYESLSFEAALDAEEQRVAPELDQIYDRHFVGNHHRHHSYVSRGLYADQLARYRAVFPVHQILVLTNDELRRDTQATVDRATDFLGLDRAALTSTTRHNARNYERMDPRVRERLTERFAEPNRRLAALLEREIEWPQPQLITAGDAR